MSSSQARRRRSAAAASNESVSSGDDDELPLEQRAAVVHETTQRLRDRLRALSETATARRANACIDTDPTTNLRYSVLERRREREARKRKGRSAIAREEEDVATSPHGKNTHPGVRFGNNNQEGRSIEEEMEALGSFELEESSRNAGKTAFHTQPAAPGGTFPPVAAGAVSQTSPQKTSTKLKGAKSSEAAASPTATSSKRLSRAQSRLGRSKSRAQEEQRTQVEELLEDLTIRSRKHLGRFVESVTYPASAEAPPPFDVPMDLLLRFAGWRMRVGYDRRAFLADLLEDDTVQLAVDCFWFVHCHLFQCDSEWQQEVLLQSLSQRWLTLRGRIAANADNFFNQLPFAVASAIFSGFYFLLPGSKSRYTPTMKLHMFLIVVRLLTGMDMAPLAVSILADRYFPDEVPQPPGRTNPPPQEASHHHHQGLSATEPLEGGRSSSGPSRRQRRVQNHHGAAKDGFSQEASILGFAEAARRETLRSLPVDLLLPSGLGGKQQGGATLASSGHNSLAGATGHGRASWSPQSSQKMAAPSPLQRGGMVRVPHSPLRSGGVSSRPQNGAEGELAAAGNGARDDSDDAAFTYQALIQRSRRRPITNTFSLKQTGPLTQRLLASSTAPAEFGRASSMRRFIPLPWGSVGGVDTFQASETREDVADRVEDRQQTLQRIARRIMRGSDLRQRAVTRAASSLREAVLAGRVAGVSNLARDIQTQQHRAMEERRKGRSEVDVAVEMAARRRERETSRARRAGGAWMLASGRAAALAGEESGADNDDLVEFRTAVEAGVLGPPSVASMQPTQNAAELLGDAAGDDIDGGGGAGGAMDDVSASAAGSAVGEDGKDAGRDGAMHDGSGATASSRPGRWSQNRWELRNTLPVPSAALRFSDQATRGFPANGVDWYIEQGKLRPIAAHPSRKNPLLRSTTSMSKRSSGAIERADSSPPN